MVRSNNYVSHPNLNRTLFFLEDFDKAREVIEGYAIKSKGKGTSCLYQVEDGEITIFPNSKNKGRVMLSGSISDKIFEELNGILEGV